VKDKIASELEAIAYAKVPADRQRQHWALLNLAAVIIDDVGPRFNLDKGLTALHDSASLGNVQSRQLLLHLYHDYDQSIITPQVRETWVQTVIEAGIRWPTKRMAASAEELSRHYCAAMVRESFKHGGGDGAEDVDAFNSRCIRTDPCSSLAWRHDILQYSIINDQLELLKMVVSERPDLINKITDGETPVLLSSRHGNLAIVKWLIEQGAKLGTDSSLCTMPLHWLFRFPEKDQEEALKLLKAAGNDVNAWDPNSCGIGTPLWFSSFSDLPVQGTALHWAIDAQSLSALRLLMENGADPLYRVHTGSEKSAFAYACCLSYAPAIELFLEYEAVRNSFASLTKLTKGLQVLVQPLFWVTTGDSRWRMLMRNGLEFEEATRRTIELLVKHGASTRVVMYEADSKLEMSAAFSAAYHDCNPDVLRSGFQQGFGDGVDCTWGDASSGGSGIFLTLTHHNRGAFTQFLENGADLSAVDKHGDNLLLRAAKETDDLFYIQELVKAGVLFEPKVVKRAASAFSIAVYLGNFKTARWLYEQGFDRDEFFPDHKYPIPEPTRFRTPLSLALKHKTRGNEQRVQFLLSLPDRNNGTDGFIAWRFEGKEYSALHCVMDMLAETAEYEHTAMLMVFALLQKYNTPYHLNMCQPHDGATTLSLAACKGQHQIVRALLEAGADLNCVDMEGKTPLDHALERYCYPERNVLFLWEDGRDPERLKEKLEYFNGNTAEVLSILECYGAETRTFEWPEWSEGDPGLRDLDWLVMQLTAHREK
jgi:ankyrin repeat protein